MKPKQRVENSAPGDYKIFLGENSVRTQGVALVVKSGILVTRVVTLSGRVMYAEIGCGKERKIRWVVAYAPTNENGTAEEKEEFYSDLRHACDVGRRVKVVVLGDFNGNLGTIPSPSRGIFGVEPRNENGKLLTDFAEQHGFSIVNTLYIKRSQKSWATWIHPRSKKAYVLDYCLGPKSCLQTLRDCKAVYASRKISDHRLLLIIAKGTISRTRRTRPPVRYKVTDKDIFLEELKEIIGNQHITDWEVLERFVVLALRRQPKPEPKRSRRGWKA